MARSRWKENSIRTRKRIQDNLKSLMNLWLCVGKSWLPKANTYWELKKKKKKQNDWPKEIWHSYHTKIYMYVHNVYVYTHINVNIAGRRCVYLNEMLFLLSCVYINMKPGKSNGKNENVKYLHKYLYMVCEIFLQVMYSPL